MMTKIITQLHDVTPDELKESIIHDLRKELKILAQNFQPQKKEEEFLTRKEVADLLQISLVTIFHWSKQGVIKPYRIGKLIRFKRSEIESALIAIKN